MAWLTHLRYTYFFFTALVPDEVKREMLIKIRSFLAANSWLFIYSHPLQCSVLFNSSRTCLLFLLWKMTWKTCIALLFKLTSDGFSLKNHRSHLAHFNVHKILFAENNVLRLFKQKLANCLNPLFYILVNLYWKSRPFNLLVFKCVYVSSIITMLRLFWSACVILQ